MVKENKLYLGKLTNFQSMIRTEGATRVELSKLQHFELINTLVGR
jgi:hypothetical protein